MKVIVLGAGLLGVTSAYFLRQQGHDVTVIDRQATPAAETSFANGGQISVSHAEPWANPSAPLKVLKWLGKEDAPLLFSMAHQVSLTDDKYKLVFSRLGDRLRIAGTAELNGYDRDLNRVRREAIVRRSEELFPGAGDTEQAQFWTGLRPATPSNVPIIGRSKIANLYPNTGHGTLGWTHSCGSGKSIARIINGLAPEVDFAFTGIQARATRASSVELPA